MGEEITLEIKLIKEMDRESMTGNARYDTVTIIPSLKNVYM